MIDYICKINKTIDLRLDSLSGNSKSNVLRNSLMAERGSQNGFVTDNLNKLPKNNLKMNGRNNNKTSRK